MTLFLLIYRLLWIPLTPLALLYFWYRGRKSPEYRSHMAERFGFYGRPLPQQAFWVHAISLGEMRSAVPLIRLLLDRGDPVVVTHLTPAGRRESARAFGPELASGQMAAIWAPLDIGWCYRRFFRAIRPRMGLSMEVDLWPVMMVAARRARVPLYLCNGQYGRDAMARDGKGFRLRQRMIQQLIGAFVKSAVQAARFMAVGVTNTHVTGELRFDQPIPAALLSAAAAIRPRLVADRPAIVIASGVADEEPLYLSAILALKARAQTAGTALPLWIYVPRAPERFAPVAEDLERAGLRVMRRSTGFGPGMAGLAEAHLPDAPPDVLLGDSLGEMYFYLALADRVVIGSSFTPRGAHNIIEPLALRKPVITGPHVWTIEYPFTEAEAAGLATRLPDGAALVEALASLRPPSDADFDTFMAEHSGAARRTLTAIDAELARMA